MPWLTPSLIATASGTALLVFVYFYLYFIDRKQFLLIWAVSWSVYFIRFIFELCLVMNPGKDALLIGNQISSLMSGIILLWGTYRFLEKGFPKFWIYFSGIGIAWIVISVSFRFSFLLMSIPTFAFLSIVYLCTGWILIESRKTQGAAITLTGGTFIVWGLHKADYPFMQPLAWFAPWGYLLGAVLEFTVAIGMLLVYFQKVRDELKNEKYFLQKAQEIGKVGTWELNTRTNVLRWTDENYKIFGLPAGTKLTYEIFLNCVHPDDRQNVDSKWKSAFAGEPYDIEHRLIANGEVKWVREKAELTFNEKNECVKGTGFTQDVTERKLAEQALLAQTRTLEAVFQSAPYITILVDHEVRVKDINRKGLQFTGRDSEELSGLLCGQVFECVHSLDVQGCGKNSECALCSIRSLVMRTFETGEPTYEKEGRLVVVSEGVEVSLDILISTTLIHNSEESYVLITIADITDRMHAERLLRANEEKYRIITENTADIISIMDMDLRFTYISPSVMRLRGYTVEEALSQHLEEILTSESLIIALSTFEREMQLEASGTADPGRTLTLELEEFKKDGSTVWTEINLSYLRDSALKPVGIVAVARDITERKRAETALNDMQRRTTAILKSIADTFFSLDQYWRFTVVNPAAEQAPFGRPASELLGNVIWELYPALIGTRIHQYYMDAAKKYTLEHYEAQSPLNNRWYEVFMQGWTGGVDVYMRDITERKQAEELLRESETKYRSMMEAMDDAVYICSNDFRIKYMNSALIKIIGYDATGEPCHKVLHGLEEKCPWCVHDKVMAGRSVKTEVVSPMDNRIYHVSNSPIFHANGEISKLTIFRDITETKKIEERLLQSQKLEAIGSLAGGIAHDLNNILFPISGLAEMLLDEIPPYSPAYESIDQIHKSAQRGSDLVKQILTFSRQSNPQKMPIRIQPILKEVLKLFRATIPAHIEITSQIISECGMISADPTQVHQILMNLITNAFHAVEKSGGAIHIELKETALERDGLLDNSIQPGRFACMAITDTGVGMDQNMIDKIFDPYFTTKEQGKGTGLGLSVVHGIVKEHGGMITVTSEAGKGSRFQVYLPVIDVHEDGKAAIASNAYPTGSESILLVDDEEPIAKMMKMMLERLGYRVTIRVSSPDALNAFKANPSNFDLVISDRGMPNMTGEQLARELIAIRPEIPIVLCTGFSDENDEKRAKDMGIKGVLKKPVASGKLAVMVRTVLDDSKKPNPVRPRPSGNAPKKKSGF